MAEIASSKPTASAAVALFFGVESFCRFCFDTSLAGTSLRGFRAGMIVVGRIEDEGSFPLQYRNLTAPVAGLHINALLTLIFGLYHTISGYVVSCVMWLLESDVSVDSWLFRNVLGGALSRDTLPIQNQPCLCPSTRGALSWDTLPNL